MSDFTSHSTQVNNYSSLGQQIPTSEPVRILPSLKRLIHKELDTVIQLKGYKGIGSTLLREIAKDCSNDVRGQWARGQEGYAKLVNASSRTVRTWIKQYIADGILKSEPVASWLDKKPNLITLLCIQHVLPHVPEKISDDLSNLDLTLGDLTNNITYDDYVSASPNLEKKQEPAPVSKHIDAKALDGPDPDGEVIRICMAWLLCEKKTRFAVLSMRDRSKIKTTAVKYLASMVKGLANGTWKWEVPDDDKPKLSANDRRVLETELRERARKDAIVVLAQSGIHEPTTFDPYHEYHGRLSTNEMMIFRKLLTEHGLLNNGKGN